MKLTAPILQKGYRIRFGDGQEGIDQSAKPDFTPNRLAGSLFIAHRYATPLFQIRELMRLFLK